MALSVRLIQHADGHVWSSVPQGSMRPNCRPGRGQLLIVLGQQDASAHWIPSSCGFSNGVTDSVAPPDYAG
jgi:hypothetical protein